MKAAEFKLLVDMGAIRQLMEVLRALGALRRVHWSDGHRGDTSLASLSASLATLTLAALGAAAGAPAAGLGGVSICFRECGALRMLVDLLAPPETPPEDTEEDVWREVKMPRLPPYPPTPPCVEPCERHRAHLTPRVAVLSHTLLDS